MTARPDQRGFTLIEAVVVFGMFALIGGFALFVSMESFRGSSFRSDRNLLVAALQRARSQSVNNVCLGTCTDGRPHGVRVLSGSLLIFQGASYASRDSSVDANFQISQTTQITGASEVAFSPISATTSSAVNIVMSDQGGHISTTTISSQGQISWTN